MRYRECENCGIEIDAREVVTRCTECKELIFKPKTNNMKELTKEEKIDIALEMLKEEPLETLGQIALLKLSELAINANSDETVLSTEATFNGKRYKCKMLVTYSEINK
jgi:hypothetical protein